MIQCGYGQVKYNTNVYFPVSFYSYARVIPCIVNPNGYMFDNLYAVTLNSFICGTRTSGGATSDAYIMWIACGF